MKKIILLVLRIPIIAVGAAAVLIAVAKPLFSNFIMCVAVIAFCVAIWHGLEALNGPSESVKERVVVSSGKMTKWIWIVVIAILVFEVLQKVFPHI